MATGVSRADLASFVDRMRRKGEGASISRLQRVSTADLDALATLMDTSGPPLIKYRIGGWYSGEGGSISTLLLTEDQLVVGPILVEQFCVVEEIGVDVTTAGSEGNLYTALYADNGNGYPGALIHASAALTVTPGAFKSTAALDIELPPGLYWGGAVCNQVTTTVATVRSLIGNSPYVGETAGANDVAMAGYASPATVTGAPPATFSSTVAVVGAVPRLMFKIKNT